MELTNAITQRRSVRGYLDRPVSQETLRQVLELATRAVSAVNSQPWEFAVVTGDVLDALRRDNVDRLRRGEPTDVADTSVSGVYRERQVAIGRELFAAMGIERGDRASRSAWTERGFRFFDAPAAIVVSMDAALGAEYRLDLGCVIQNLCLAAMEFGLGTCVEYQATLYRSGLRTYLGLGEDKIPVCGIAIGYPDWEFPANQVVSRREDVDRITAWHGFD